MQLLQESESLGLPAKQNIKIKLYVLELLDDLNRSAGPEQASLQFLVLTNIATTSTAIFSF
jgi:hypothetical protein